MTKPADQSPASEPASTESQDQGGTPSMKVFREDVIEALKTVHDPEIPVNIHDLGLVYDVAIENGHDVRIRMTLTTPNCPEAQNIPDAVRESVRQYVPGVRRVHVDIVWEPRWTKDMMSEDARLALDMF
jgi:FeS assembly SUF system protein